ncbi:hypothetical protein [Vannielia sp.]|nr:hypothetical protein [Vannielia sp.]MDF1871156.1 hypothetical protein [Vannielia sp.]
MLTRDEMIREVQMRRGNWPGLLAVYAILVGTMAMTAMAIV